MVQEGKSITTTNDELKKVQIEYVFHTIRNPKPELANKIKQLRIVRSIDSKQYAILKKQLPYIVCGIFNPPYRRVENFLYTEYFILDIDKISDKMLSIPHIKEELKKDERVVMIFISPGEDGLKVMFRLKERCFDSNLYSLFYKIFAEKFSTQYQLLQVLDNRTSDVSRACFLSYDEDIYYNPTALPVSLSDFIDVNNPAELFDLKKQLLLQEKEMLSKEDLLSNDETEDKEPPQDTIEKIKEILKLKKEKVKEKTAIFVPQELNQIMEDLQQYLIEHEVEVCKIIDIQYGKKIRMSVKHRLAEINIFYGKKGFSVVKSPRSGTSAELNELLANLIKGFFN